MKAVFDTNILIDFLNGIEAAEEELSKYRFPFISIITFMEVLVGAGPPEEEKILRRFLGSFEVVELSSRIAEETVLLKKAHRLKIPDAIVYATARVEGCMLVSRNTRDLKPAWPDIRVPYSV